MYEQNSNDPSSEGCKKSLFKDEICHLFIVIGNTSCHSSGGCPDSGGFGFKECHPARCVVGIAETIRFCFCL